MDNSDQFLSDGYIQEDSEGAIAQNKQLFTFFSGQTYFLNIFFL